MNSISCRIWEGRFDSKRDIILKWVSLRGKYGETDRRDYARLERLRKHADDQAELYDIDCVG